MIAFYIEIQNCNQVMHSFIFHLSPPVWKSTNPSWKPSMKSNSRKDMLTWWWWSRITKRSLSRDWEISFPKTALKTRTRRYSMKWRKLSVQSLVTSCLISASIEQISPSHRNLHLLPGKSQIQLSGTKTHYVRTYAIPMSKALRLPASWHFLLQILRN